MTKDFASDALRSALEKKTPLWARALLWLLATAVFYGFAWHARYATMDLYSAYEAGGLKTLTAAMFAAIYAVSLGVQLRVGRNQTLSVHLLLAAITGAVLLGKISLLDYVSDDYSIFLNNWIGSYTTMNLKEGLGTYIGSDYTPPYLYLMYAVSRFPDYPWLYMVKAISIATDVLLAYVVMKLASLRVKGEGARLMFFHITAILPTVVFNGAYWGQCDAIYVSFCLLAVYLALRKKPCRSLLCFGVALSFKLQTVFFLPVLLPLWLRKDVKLRHVLLIPVGYMAMMVPALWGGKSLHHVLTCYLQQAGTYNFLTMNAPSLYQFLPADASQGGPIYTMFSSMAIFLGFAAMAAVCLLLALHHRRISKESTLLYTTLMLAAVPFFLPKMHERYTFGADVLSLALCAYAPKRVVLPLLFGFASYICYTEGLPGEPVMALKWATMFQFMGIALTAYELARVLRRDRALTEVSTDE